MTTGVDILRIFDREVDQAYTDFESTTQKTDRFKVAMTNVVEKIYRGLDTQKDYDDIRSLIIIDKYLALTSGSLRLTPSAIASVSISIIPPSNIYQVVLTFASAHGLSSSDMGSLVFSNSENSGVSAAAWNVFTIYNVTSANQLLGYSSVPVTGTYIPNSVSVYSSSTTAGNYNHLLAVRPLYQKPVAYEYSRIASVNGSKIKFLRPNSLRTGDVIRITTSPLLSGFQQDIYLKRLNSLLYEAYSDSLFVSAISLPSIPSNTNYSITVLSGDYAEKMSAHELVSRFSGRRTEFPGYLIDQNKIIFRPNQPVPTHAYLSYIRSDAVFFDLSSTSLDYETIYSRKFIQRVIDEAVSDFNRSVRDYNALGAENNQITTNP
jgi:hypothetical protein